MQPMQPSQQNLPSAQQPGYQPMPVEPLPTNRKVFKYILLTIVTFGIYWFIFWSKYAKDMNTVCYGDGKRTRGAAFRFFITPLTSGIYDYVWTFGNAKRLYNNCTRRGIPYTLTGGKALLWSTLGALITVGPFVVLHKVFNGINWLCDEYNVAHGYPSTFARAAEYRAKYQNGSQGYSGQRAMPGDGFGMPAAAQGQVPPPREPMVSVPGTQEAAGAIQGAVKQTENAMKSAGLFARKTATSMGLDVEDQAGMKWLPILPMVSALCFLLSFIFGLSAQPSLFSVLAALGLALICFLKTDTIKPLSALPFSVMAIQLLQISMWYLPYIRYFGVFQWVTLIVSLLLMGGAVIHWLVLYGKPSLQRTLWLVVPGALALMALFYIVCFFISPYYRLDLGNNGGGNPFSIFMGTLGNVIFAVSYLLLIYRSNFRLLTGVNGETAGQPAAQTSPKPDPGFVEVPQPIPPTYENGSQGQRSWQEPAFNPEYGNDAGYAQRPQPPRIEMEPPVTYIPPRNAFDYPPAPAAPNPQVDAGMAACPSCGYLSPAGTEVCPGCGAPMRMRRRRSTSY